LDKLTYLEAYVMPNLQRYKNTAKARRTKTREACISSMLAKPTNMKPAGNNCAGWYKQKQRFSQRLYSLTKGKIVLRDDYPFRGLNAWNWVQSETRCQHVYLASLKLIFELGADNVCPFCNIPDDLTRCGSIQAVQQNVESLSYSNIEFLAENELKGPDDLYAFACLIHQFKFAATYRDSINNPEQLCHICTFGNGK
jgi:hypothetical protein